MTSFHNSSFLLLLLPVSQNGHPAVHPSTELPKTAAAAACCHILVSNFREAWVTKTQCRTSLHSRSAGPRDYHSWFPALHRERCRWHFLVVCQTGFVPSATMCPVKGGGGGELWRERWWPKTAKMNHMSPSLNILLPQSELRCRSQDEGSGSPHCSLRQGIYHLHSGRDALLSGGLSLRLETYRNVVYFHYSTLNVCDV